MPYTATIAEGVYNVIIGGNGPYQPGDAITMTDDAYVAMDPDIFPIIFTAPPVHVGGGGGGSGAVDSVNGQTGDVVITAASIGAAPTSRSILAGTGATGGGTLAADRTIAVSYGTTSGTAAQGNDSRIAGALQAASNLSDLADASAARTSLALGNSATRTVGTTNGTVAAGDDSRITGAAQKASNLSDLANAGTARTNLGLGGAATLAVGTTAGTVAAGDDSRITGAAQKSQNLADLANATTARTNLGLGNSATRAVGTTAGTVAAGDDSRFNAAPAMGPATVDLVGWTTPPETCSQKFSLANGLLAMVLIRAVSSATITKLGVWIGTAGVTGTGLCALALYTEAGALLSQTGDMAAAFASATYSEGTLAASQAVTAGTNYYVAMISTMSTAPLVLAANAANNIPVIRNHRGSITLSSQTSFPSSVTPSSLSLNSAAYFMTMGT